MASKENKTPVKVLIEEVKANIRHTFYFTAEDGIVGNYDIDGLRGMDQDSLSRFTICVLVLQNGFVIIGTNACVNKETWNRMDGQKYAYENALNQVWLLMGYELKTKQYYESIGNEQAWMSASSQK